MNDLQRRIIDISYKQGLSHIGSCLTVVDIIDSIYKNKKKDEPFVLSSGHAHLAHLVVREKYEGYKIGKIHDIHCNQKDGCYVSTGSLGMGIGISVGIALADRSKATYCVTTDGELAEGSCWEAINIAAELQLKNLIIVVNANGYGAFKEIDRDRLLTKLNGFVLNGCPKIAFVRTELPKYDFVTDQQEWHYKCLNKEEYEKITS